MTPNIAITIDDNYVQHACVMLESLRSTNHGSINVHCIYEKLSPNNIELLKKHLYLSNLNLNFIEFKHTFHSILPLKEGDHLTLATYLRIWLPSILSDIDQVLFLDTDMVINDDISYLLNLDVKDFPIAAVEAIGTSNEKKLTLGIPANKKYFNAGVLKINLKYFRINHLSEKLLKFISINRDICEFHDQDALNAVIKGDFYNLDCTYNMQSAFFEQDHYRKEKLLEQAFKRPAIIHFTGAGICKPWMYRNTHPFKDTYYKYLKTTPFLNYISPDQPGKLKMMRRKIKKQIKDFFR